ncbi:MAG: bifunctional adenosylcobinamide kinase/adenosylcobinamide-phosphate guanylyltransferase [Pseudomonadota bacterium]
MDQKKYEKKLPHMTLVLGGASSGKSKWAESLAKLYGGRRVYVATAQAFDSEMTAKIEAHRLARAGDGWETLEAPHDAPGALRDCVAEVALLDCATLWLSNRLFAEADLEAECSELGAAARGSDAPVIVVSNEVGAGIVPENALARRFRSAQGALNQDLARAADLVVLVTAGLPLVLKGILPEAVV